MNYVLSCPFNISESSDRILWEVTSRCNMKCKHCLYYSEDYAVTNNELTTEQIFNLIDQISAAKTVNEIWISGGEPLLRSDIMQIISKINDNGIKPSISTNAYLVDRECAINLKKNGIDYVHVSIDGVNSAIHDSFRRKPGAFDRVMSAIDYLNEAGLMVGATYMVTNENVADIEEMIRYAIKKRIIVLSFYLVAPIGRGVNQVMQDDNHTIMLQLHDKVNTLINQYKEQIRIELFRTIADSSDDKNYLKECKGQYFLTITSNGELGACPWLIKSKNSILFSLECFTFLEAKNKVQTEMIQLVSNRKAKLTVCSSCKQNIYCRQGCPAVSDDTMVDPLCNYIRRLDN